MSSFVRSLTNAEGQHIQRILRHGKSRTPFRRAQVIIHSAHGYTVQEIARVTCLHEEYIRELIRQFNVHGVALFKERARSGRPVEFVPEIRADIVEIALSPPKLLGCPFTHWSLEKLREHILRVSVVSKISLETLRSILKEEGVHLQRTKTWKESKDPAFHSKKNG
ncbi:MAG: helix-turn-helix domain-containing protein [Bacteroidota bacterium]